MICASVRNSCRPSSGARRSFLADYKTASRWFIDAVGVAVIVLAFKQFFALDPRRDGWRLALAAALFLGIKWGLQRLYGLAVIRWVLH